MEKVVVKNIPKHFDDEMIRELVTHFGDVKSLNIIKNKCIVIYNDIIHAKKAIKHLNGKLIENKKLYCNFENKNNKNNIKIIKKRQINNNYKYISFLFGSRENEITKLFEYFDSLENYIYTNNLEWEIFIPTLPHLTEIIKNKTKLWKTKTTISNDISKFDKYFDEVFVSVTCSGTASLEIAKRNIPQIIIYKLNYLTELILKLFVKVKRACILNIVTSEIIIPEIVNSNLTKNNIINSFKKLLDDKQFRSNQIININKNLCKIESDISPYEISANRINSLI